MRALIDQGSQLSLISASAAQRLGLSPKACKRMIFGIGTQVNHCKGVVSFEASAVHTNHTFNGQLFVINNLLNNLPNTSVIKPSWGSLDYIQLADLQYNISRPIDVLLGADVYSQIILGGIIREPQSQLVAQQTRLGWILCGNVRPYQCNVVRNKKDDKQNCYLQLPEISNIKTHDIQRLRHSYTESEYYDRVPLHQHSRTRQGIILPAVKTAAVHSKRNSSLSEVIRRPSISDHPLRGGGRESILLRPQCSVYTTAQEPVRRWCVSTE